MSELPNNSTQSRGSLKPRKRIVVACDGTWMNSDGEYQVPSNVTRICRCIKSQGFASTESGSDERIPQIIYYQSGVGAEGGAWAHIVGGATGAGKYSMRDLNEPCLNTDYASGISENIREAYSFICNNYENGDEIFLIGFSRGAFTARSISSLIRAIGLLTMSGLVYFYQIFKDWEYQEKDDWVSPYQDQPFPGPRPKVTTPEYRRKLQELEYSRFDITIKACAVWDTVGALGIPMIGLFPQPASHDYSFVDTKIEPIIEYAFQALALDEHRRQYSPTIWERPDGQAWPVVLKQCWFPGAHSDIGGSYEDADLSNITLAWMISQLDNLLAFDKSYVRHQYRLSEEAHRIQGERKPREWGLGHIHNSMTGLFLLGGKQIRTPGDYAEIDRKTMKEKVPRQRLSNTNEVVHASVRVRMGLGGLGYNDKGFYDSEALKGWQMKGTLVADQSRSRSKLPPLETEHPLEKLTNVRWFNDPGENDAPQSEQFILPEDTLGDLEMDILKDWHKYVWEQLPTLSPGGHANTLTKAESFPLNGISTSEAGELSTGRERAGSRRSNTFR